MTNLKWYAMIRILKNKYFREEIKMSCAKNFGGARVHSNNVRQRIYDGRIDRDLGLSRRRRKRQPRVIVTTNGNGERTHRIPRGPNITFSWGNL